MNNPRYVIDTSTETGKSLATKLMTPVMGVVQLTSEEMNYYLSSKCVQVIESAITPALVKYPENYFRPLERIPSSD